MLYPCFLTILFVLKIDLINATGSIKEVLQIILKEFEYQSSLELDSDTFDSISHIPVANQIGIHARQVCYS
jgi:adenylate kinase